MTERLYHADAYRTRFTARVIERLTQDGYPAVVLDRTCFYPTSGGQPCDHGTLGGAQVVNVVAREEDGAVLHLLAQEVAHDEVEGQVDWPRRFDHMQQHTGQHVLSAAFEQVLDADTVGFHLGDEASTIDLDVAPLLPSAVDEVEDLANRVVWEDRPVTVHTVTPEELPALRLRRPPQVAGPIRIVEIQGFDANPCGGTHMARTGEVGLIKVVRLDYRGEETRVEFRCGERALRDYRQKNAVVNRLAADLTVSYRELDRAVARLCAEGRELRRELRQAQRRLLAYEAAELMEAAIVHGPYQVVWQVWERREPGELRALAQELAQRPGVVALLVGVGERAHLCFARAEGLNLDIMALLRLVCTQLGGKGGGQPHLAQGSAPVTDVSRVEAALASLLPSLGLKGNLADV